VSLSHTDPFEFRHEREFDRNADSTVVQIAAMPFSVNVFPALKRIGWSVIVPSRERFFM